MQKCVPEIFCDIGTEMFKITRININRCGYNDVFFDKFV